MTDTPYTPIVRKDDWIAALESGDYIPAAGILRKDRQDGGFGHCCLGVLAELKGLNLDGLPIHHLEVSEINSLPGNRVDPKDSLMNWLSGELPHTHRCATINDRNDSYEERIRSDGNYTEVVEYIKENCPDD